MSSILSLGFFVMAVLSINCGAYIFGVIYLTLGCGVYLISFQSLLDEGNKRRNK